MWNCLVATKFAVLYHTYRCPAGEACSNWQLLESIIEHEAYRLHEIENLSHHELPDSPVRRRFSPQVLKAAGGPLKFVTRQKLYSFILNCVLTIYTIPDIFNGERTG